MLNTSSLICLIQRKGNTALDTNRLSCLLRFNEIDGKYTVTQYLQLRIFVNGIEKCPILRLALAFFFFIS